MEGRSGAAMDHSFKGNMALYGANIATPGIEFEAKAEPFIQTNEKGFLVPPPQIIVKDFYGNKVKGNAVQRLQIRATFNGTANDLIQRGGADVGMFGATVQSPNENSSVVFNSLGLTGTPGSGPWNLFFDSEMSIGKTHAPLKVFIRPCPENEYLDTDQCSKCRAFSTSPAGSMSSKNCSCNDGLYFKDNTCKSCPLHAQTKKKLDPATQEYTMAEACICEANYYASGQQAITCNECPSGSYSEKGSTSSDDCSAASSTVFKSKTGTFVSCPLNSNLKNTLNKKQSFTSAEACSCNANHYSEFSDGQMTCNKCQAFSTAPPGSISPTDCECDPGSYLSKSSCLFCDDNKYLDNMATDKTEWDCADCPIGASCIGDVAWSGVLPKFGWSKCHNNDFKFEQCTFPAACLGGTNPALMGKYYLDKEYKKIDLAECKISGNCTAQCNTAYVNNSFLCGQCAYNYSHDGLTGRCDTCPPLAENIGVAIGGGFLGLLGLFIYIRITLSDGGHLDESDGAKSIGLSFIQLISLLVTFPIAW